MLKISNYLDGIHTVFFTKKKTCKKRIFKGRSYFLNEKLKTFHSKNSFAPIDFLLARLLSAARNSACHA